MPLKFKQLGKKKKKLGIKGEKNTFVTKLKASGKI